MNKNTMAINATINSALYLSIFLCTKSPTRGILLTVSRLLRIKIPKNPTSNAVNALKSPILCIYHKPRLKLKGKE